MRVENIGFLATDFIWKITNVVRLEQAIDGTTTAKSKKSHDTHLISQFSISVTLQKGRPERLQGSEWDHFPRINEGLLTDVAFKPKEYTVRLEQGRLRTQYDMLNGGKNMAEWTPWFAHRLVFDVSPYPPREQWKDGNVAPIAVFKPWEWTEFCAGVIEKEEMGGGGVVGTLLKWVRARVFGN